MSKLKLDDTSFLLLDDDSRLLLDAEGEGGDGQIVYAAKRRRKRQIA